MMKTYNNMTIHDFYIGPEKYRSDILNEIEEKLHSTLDKYKYYQNTKEFQEKIRLECQAVLEYYIEQHFLKDSIKYCVTISGDGSTVIVELKNIKKKKNIIL